MSEPKKPKGEPDRHLSGKMIRLPLDLHDQLAKLAQRNDRPMTWELRRALEAALKEAGLWPPPGTPT